VNNITKWQPGMTNAGVAMPPIYALELTTLTFVRRSLDLESGNVIERLCINFLTFGTFGRVLLDYWRNLLYHKMAVLPIPTCFSGGCHPVSVP